jgi:hypothetical protein
LVEEAVWEERAEISVQQCRLMSRYVKLARFTQSCPLVVYICILSKVEAFDELIPFAVEALKYCSDLSREAMAFCLVSQLRAKGSYKLKEEGTHCSFPLRVLARRSRTV